MSIHFKHFSVPRSRRGFALLITLTLMAFMVLLMLSLVYFTRVEVQATENTQLRSEARSNALLALNIAIGELQKYTGPDQRTTARSDIDPALANAANASSHWTGAYGNASVADYGHNPTEVSAAIVAASDANGSQARLLNWLVSGNEFTSFDPANDVGPLGNIINSPTDIKFIPTGSVSGLSASSDALAEDIYLTDRNDAALPARLLVGPNTVGDSVADFVVAPLVEMTESSGESSALVGRYAWWVGDENIKARINQPIAEDEQIENAFVSSQRTAIELMDTFNPSGSTTTSVDDMLDPSGDDARYDPSNSMLQQIIATEQLPMLSPGASDVLETMAKYRYHDTSARSMSVLADSYAGGLKKDLSALLSTGSTEPLDTDLIFPQEPGSYNHVGVPTWGELRSFAQTTASSEGLLPRVPTMARSPDITAAAPVPTNVGVYPVMTYAAFGFRYIAPDGDAVGNPISLAAVPIVVLWNPYTTAIRGEDDSGNPIRYEVGFRKAYGSLFQLQGRAESTGAPGGAYVWGEDDIIKTYDMGKDGTDRFFRFVIESPSGGIGPGESLIFTLADNGEEYLAAQNILTNGMNDNYYVIMPKFSTTITEELGPNAYYRVAVNNDDDHDDAPQTMWGYKKQWGADRNWIVGWLEAYLGSTDTGTNYPKSSYPWNSSYSDMGIYQFFPLVAQPYVNRPPYGGGSTGFAVSGGASGLLQPEGQLGTEMTTLPPAWRIVVRQTFSNIASDGANLEFGRSRWMLQSNPRGFLMKGTQGKPANTNWPSGLFSEDDIHASSGTGFEEELNNTILYEFRPDSMPLLGIGQLQHANLGWLKATQSYAIGNSNGGGIHYNKDEDAVYPEKLYKDIKGDNAPGDKITAQYDYSWLLNRAIWDHYFVSTVPHAGTGKQSSPADTEDTEIPEVLPNANHVRHANATTEGLRDADKAAANLLLEGGFNINSTSEQAWRAVLGGTNQLNYDPTDSNAGGGAWDKITFSRFSKPTTNDTSSAWLGYKQLNEQQIAQLAKNIVEEIRKRGPSVSLAEFVNRRLYTDDETMQPGDVRLKGPIQAAIDAETTGPEAINSVDPGSPLEFLTSTTDSYKVVHTWRSPTLDPFVAGSSTPETPTPPYGTSAAGAPQFLTQADVLSAIGGKLSARSDTFVIRAYGEVLDPLTSSSTDAKVLARAWCEATVQRFPEYVDSTIDPEVTLSDLPDSSSKTTNSLYGRKYKIVSFRWLSPNEI